MRFAVATTLLAQTLPTWSLQHDQAAAESLSTNRLHEGFHRVLGLSNSNNKERLANLLGREPSFQKLKPSATTARDNFDCDPDIGVLACGMGKYCQPDDQSALGGICTSASLSNQGRKLEDSNQYYSTYCVAHIDYEYYDCDCDSWSPTTSNATKFSCVYTIALNTCVCADICYDDSLIHEWKRNGESWEFTVSSCANFKTPYYQSICAIQTDDGGCAISLDGVQCTSCTTSPDGLGYFDCENVGMGKRENSSDYAIPPIVQPCYSDYAFCSLCPEGMNITDALVTFNDYQVTCSYLETIVVAAQYSAVDCYNFGSRYQTTCCGQAFHCNICGEEDMEISLPNNAVTFEGESFTCEELVVGSQDGVISEEICSLISPAQVHESCGCISKDNETDHTTVPPTSSPTGASSVPGASSSIVGIGLLYLGALTTALMIYP